VTPWTRRLLVGAIAILVPALAGCEAGFNAPTLQFHQASVGTSAIVDGINIDNVFVLGPAPGSTLLTGGQAGLFLALQAPNGDQLTSISAPGTASSVQLADGPVILSPDALVNLDGPSPLVTLTGLTRPLSGGETVKLVLQFATAGSVTIMVPVEPAANDFTTYSPPPVPTASASLSVSLSGKHKHKANQKKAAATVSASPSVSP
jgi:copper(I)-binding protein